MTWTRISGTLLMDRVGDFVDEDTDEVVDVVLLWWRDGDGDLVDTLVDALEPARRQRRGLAAHAQGRARRPRRAERDHRVGADRRAAADLDHERRQGLGGARLVAPRAARSKR